jgi:hypothetical protein
MMISALKTEMPACVDFVRNGTVETISGVFTEMCNGEVIVRSGAIEHIINICTITRWNGKIVNEWALVDAMR